MGWSQGNGSRQSRTDGRHGVSEWTHALTRSSNQDAEPESVASGALINPTPCLVGKGNRNSPCAFGILDRRPPATAIGLSNEIAVSAAESPRLVHTRGICTATCPTHVVHRLERADLFKCGRTLRLFTFGVMAKPLKNKQMFGPVEQRQKKKVENETL